MPIIPSFSSLVVEESVITLPRYAQLVQYSECALFGVYRAGDERSACRDIWTKMNRDIIIKYLAEAQEELEQEIGYFLSPRYIVGQLSDEPNLNQRYVDSQRYRIPLHTAWHKLIEAGVRVQTDIALGAVVDHTADPAIIGPLATNATSVEEIRVYHPGLDAEIWPSSITLSGGQATIQIPRCRMVKAALVDNPAEGLAYDVISNFEATVDVRRVYTDPSTNAVLVWPHNCSSTCATNGCSEWTHTACMYVRNSDRGAVDILPANYANGAWQSTYGFGGGLECNCHRGLPSLVRLYYKAGLAHLTRQAEDAILRLAHANMPTEPCGCEVAQRLWRRDREVPPVLTRERINNPFGYTQGAYTAYEFAQSIKLNLGSVL